MTGGFERFSFAKIVASMTPCPVRHLAEIAKGDDPAALMARRLMILKQDDWSSRDRSRELIEEARAALLEVARDERWSPVNEHRNATDPRSDKALREVLIQSGMRALTAMFSQNESGDPS